LADSLPEPFGKLQRTFLSRPADVRGLFLDNFSVFDDAQRGSLFTRNARERMENADAYAYQLKCLEEGGAAELLDKLLYSDIKTYLHELLMKQDRMSMAASIESRVPFLDHRLAEFSSKLPARMKLRNGTSKWILREAMKGILPDEILTRPKMGFPVPLAGWLRGTHRHIVDEYVLSERALARGIFDEDHVKGMVSSHQAGADLSEQLFRLINFEIWLRRFIDREQ
jgi:asparagine synthase (glutamine-hydrolysing)